MIRRMVFLALIMLITSHHGAADTFAGRSGMVPEDINLESLKEIGIEVLKGDSDPGVGMRRVDLIVSESFDPLEKSVMLILVDSKDESVRMVVQDVFSRGGHEFSILIEQGYVLVLSLAVDLSAKPRYYKVEL